MKQTNNEHNSKRAAARAYRIRIAVVASVIAASSLVAAWTLSDNHSIGSDKPINKSSPQSESTSQSDAPAQAQTAKVTQKETIPTVKQSQTAKDTSARQASAKAVAHTIEVKDGITYADGILIANKTYSLPSDYSPGLDPKVQQAFDKMREAAQLEGISLWICSGYRGYDVQQQLYNNYVARDGKDAADTYSARPGHSEHQTGLAIDVNEPSSDFDGTAEAKWLAAHCNDYGFIIRYKPGKEASTGYMAESWHIRYLGDPELCRKIEASGQSLEEYLGITSRYAQ